MSKTLVLAEDESAFPPLRRVTAGGVEYRFGGQIGVGAFSKVHKGVDQWGNRVVVKVLSPDANPRLWENEVLALHRFRHPCIVHLEASFTHQGHRFLVMRDAGVCVARLTYAPRVNTQVGLAIARCVLQALQFVHDGGYIHGDMSPNNVLAHDPKPTSSSLVRLGDFAFCRPVKSLGKGKQMFAPWQHAPENLEPGRFGSLGTATDVYLAALMIHRIATGDRYEFTEDETVRGEPRARVLETPLGPALADALALDAGSRPSALGLWHRLRAITLPSTPPQELKPSA